MDEADDQLIATPSEFADFMLEKELGHGGMGGVYLGRDKMLDRKVAIKVMLKSYGDDPTFVERFKKEAQAAAKLNHPNIAQIYSFNIFEGRPYIAMELVSGGSLDGQIEKSPGSLDVVYVMKLGQQIASALALAAEQGLVHGDVKPENILFDTDGNGKLVDFGLAAMQGESNEIWGTPYYISPEKVRRQKVDFRADIYSLGGTLYHAITGVPPFEGETPKEVVKARFLAPPRKPSELRADVPPEVDEIIMRMLEVEPARRYPTYNSLNGDIGRFLQKAGPARRSGVAGSGKKIVLKGHAGRSSTGPLRNPTLTHSDLRAAVQAAREANEAATVKEKNVGAIVGAVVGGIVGLLLLIGGGLAWYVHHADEVKKAQYQRSVLDVQERARTSLDKSIKGAIEFEDQLRDLCNKGIKAVESATDQVQRLLPEGFTRADLVPAVPAELEAALGAEFERSAEDDVDAAAKEKARAAAAAKAKAERERKAKNPSKADLIEQERQANLARAKARARKPRVIAEYDPADPDAPKLEPEKEEAPEPVAQAAGAALEPPPKPRETPPAVLKIRELWADAYVCSQAVVTVRSRVAKLDDYAAKMKSYTAADQPTAAAMAKLANDLVDEVNAIRGLPIVVRAQKCAGVINTKSKNVVDQTIRDLKRAKDRLDAEQAAKRRQAEERAAAEARAAAYKAKLEEELASADAKYQSLQATLLRHLDCTPAINQLDSLREDFTTAEGKAKLDSYALGVRYMRGMQEYFARTANNFKFKNGSSIQCRPGKRDLTFVPPGGKSARRQNLSWDQFIIKNPALFNELIIHFIEKGQDTAKLSLIDWSLHMMGAAMTLRTLFLESEASAAIRAERLARAAVKGFDSCRSKAERVFPDIDFSVDPEEDAGKAAEAEDSDEGADGDKKEGGGKEESAGFGSL